MNHIDNRPLGADPDSWTYAIVESAVEAIATIDSRGILQYVNPATERLFGYTRDEMIGRNVSMLMPSPDRDRHDAYIARYLETAEPRIIGIGREVEGLRKDGSRFPMHLAVSEVRVEGRRIFTGIIHDLTQQREAEARLFHASKLASIGELAAGVGHEINNPVNGILNCADIILNEAEPASTIHDFAQLIRSEANRIASIVRNLLTFSRQDGIHVRETDLGEIVQLVMSLCRKMLQRSHVDVTIELEPELPKPWCREGQLQQVLMNLVINALHALDEKYPESHPDKRIRIVGRAADRDGAPFVALSVEDRGPGITNELRSRIFDPFFTTKGRTTGTGLGLSISDAIAREHGGALELETEPGEYSRFTVWLPIRPADAANSGEAAP
jgi:PAS domain S-box-containing protein